MRTIHRLELVEREENRLLLDVVADSGTYIRTLAVDLGEALGVGAHLEELRRVATGPFDESKSVPLTVLADALARRATGDPAPLLALLHPIDEVWREFPSIVLKDAAASAVAHGAGLASGGILALPKAFSRGARVALVNRAGKLIATGVCAPRRFGDGRGPPRLGRRRYARLRRAGPLPGALAGEANGAAFPVRRHRRPLGLSSRFRRTAR